MPPQQPQPELQPQLTPQTTPQPPAPQQPTPQAVPVKKSPVRWLVPAVVALVVLVVSGVAYAYKRGLFVLPITPATTGLEASAQGTIALADYTTKTVEATDTLPNTMRIQVYGPSTFSGYDFDGNPLTKPGILGCVDDRCAGGELRLDFIHEPMGLNGPLVSVSLASVQEEYNQWVAGGRKGIFYSSVVSVPLPTPPPRKDIDIDSFGEWIGAVYFDMNGNRADDMKGDEDILYTAFMQYYWDKNPPSRVLGWNIMTKKDPTLSDPAAIAAYRKSFESTIYQLPIFNSLFPDLIGTKIPDDVLARMKEIQAQQSDPIYIYNSRLRGFMNQVQVGLSMYSADNSSYPTTLAALTPKYLPADLYAAISISQFRYAALGSDCKGYHLGIVLKSAEPKAAHATASSVVCTGSSPDFSGVDPLMFDIVK